MDQSYELRVEGMDCANCATGITRFLERKGLEDVYVNFQTKEVRFRRTGPDAISLEKIIEGIGKMGYTVLEQGQEVPTWWTLERKLLLSALLTAPLLLHHLLMMVGSGIPGMSNHWIQFLFCLPVFVLGSIHFGVSAWGSLRSGVPNMDVLIFMGSTAAFIYSVVGLALNEAGYIFFETAATIITLVLTGNWLEKRAVAQTTSAIGELVQLQTPRALRITDSGALVEIDREEILKGHHLQVNEGDIIPADGRILRGTATVDESMLTGESLPVERGVGGNLVGGSLLLSGNVQLEVTAIGKTSVLGRMIELVKTAQQNKPDIQRLADRISAVFVPAVLAIALLTFFVGHFGFDLSARQALMNAIAVLVISCPCAMGLATPTAVMVGVGRLARNGILIRGGQTVEVFSRLRNMVFDKTGTLTTGQFRIADLETRNISPAEARALIYQIEKHSSHPIARSLVREIGATLNGSPLPTLEVTELKGKGMEARDAEGNIYQLGSGSLTGSGDAPASVQLTRNGTLLARLTLEDEVKADAADAIRYLQKEGIRPVILSGDRKEKTARVANVLGIASFHAEQLPEEKLRLIEAYTSEAPTAMVGDGINDAPALARATLGISLSDASQAAIQSAEVVLLQGKLENLKKAHAISKHTVLTIRQNLFWAFAYNIVAIPIAAAGLLNPMLGALFMAFSDVVVIGNSIRLRHKRIKW